MPANVNFLLVNLAEAEGSLLIQNFLKYNILQNKLEDLKIARNGLKIKSKKNKFIVIKK